MTEDSNAPPATEAAAEALTAEAFAHWGIDQVAYIKRSTLNGAPVYAVFAANGDQIANAPARDVAAAWVLQHDLTPLDAH